ncbi:MAG: hypothetical protein RL011_1458 [Pseudomonadota bacterium]|jgi:hypothetical protein
MSDQSDCNKLNRRQVLQKLAVAVPVTVVAANAVRAMAEAPAAKPAAAAAGPELKLVPETDATAKALKYVPDATKATRVDKMGVAGKDQNCKNCQFYTKAGEVKGQEVGKCLMLPAGMVNATGWCMSWTKKA